MKQPEKQIIFIGAGSYFTDSMLFFKKRGFKLICIEIQEKTPWFDNYNLFKSIGFQIIKDDKNNSWLNKIKLTSKTLIFRGTYSGDADQFPKMLQNMCRREMEIFYELTKKNREEKSGAKSVLAFCGDNLYKTQDYIDWFADKSQYVDFCMFDNNLIEKYILTNVPSMTSKKHAIAYFETPLEKYVYHNQCSKVDTKNFISLGRNLCAFDMNSKLCIKSFPLKTGVAKNLFQSIILQLKYRTFNCLFKKKRFQMAGVSKIRKLKSDRRLFFKVFSKHAFGLDHFYNLLDVDISKIIKHKDIFKFDKQTYLNIQDRNSPTYDFIFPQIYALQNTASKDVTYLMNGIIPVIPHIEHSFYKALYDKKMAVLVRNMDDFRKLNSMSKQEIQKYRDNIYANRDMFTFEPVGQMLLSLL